jgi:glucose/arabinose dehydrogenase
VTSGKRARESLANVECMPRWRAVLVLVLPWVLVPASAVLLPLVACEDGDDDRSIPAAPSTPDAAAPAAEGGSTEKKPTGAACRGTVLPPGGHYVAEGLCARRIATDLPSVRQIMFAPNGDLLAQSLRGQIWLLRDADRDGVFSANEVHPWATTGGNGNNPHLDVASGFVYAGSEKGVKRFAYTAGSLAGGPAEDVVVNAPGGESQGHGRHTTHVYDGWLYVHSGSDVNASDPTGTQDYDTNRSLIKRFDLSKLDGTPFDWAAGEVFTVGLRNALGFKRNPATGRIYAVVNGMDHARYGPAVSGPNEDVHLDNPGEQIVEVAQGKRYGFPFCFTAQRVFRNGVSGDVFEPGTQLRAIFDEGATPNDPSHTDEWCARNADRPVTFVQAHAAPMDLVFFHDQPKGGLPEVYRGGAFITLHGSWNRESTQTGYKVIWQPFLPDGTAPLPTSTSETTTFPYKVMFGKGTSAGPSEDGAWALDVEGKLDEMIRPVGIDISPVDGALYLSTDLGGMLYRIGLAE